MLKRLFDFSIAFILLVTLLPLILVTALFIALKIGRPVFFVQARPGYKEKIFHILKFRTMTDEKDEKGKLLPDEKRLMPLGKTIRRLSLDELPQLVNVLKGELSLVGPRPLLPEYLPLYNSEQKRRHDVLPGITGWAQINGRNALSWEEKFKLDIWYVDHQSFRLDMQILFLTFLKVLKRDGVNAKNHVTMPKFTGTKNYTKSSQSE